MHRIEDESEIDLVVTTQGFCGKISPSKVLKRNKSEEALKTIILYFNSDFLTSNNLPGLNIYLAPQNSSVKDFRLKTFEKVGDSIMNKNLESVSVDIRVS